MIRKFSSAETGKLTRGKEVSDVRIILVVSWYHKRRNGMLKPITEDLRDFEVKYAALVLICEDYNRM